MSTENLTQANSFQEKEFNESNEKNANEIKNEEGTHNSLQSPGMNEENNEKNPVDKSQVLSFLIKKIIFCSRK